MKEIGLISLERLNNGAHFQYLSNTLKRALKEEKVSTESHLVPLLDTLKRAIQTENKNLGLSRKSLYTDKIAAADKLRDKLFKAYKRSIKAYINFPEPQFAEAAKTLQQHIMDYDINPLMQLDRQTGLMSNFIADLQTKYAEPIETLSLTLLVTQLQTANAQVIASTNKRTEERMNFTTRALKKARAASDRAYRAFVKMVNALALVNGDEAYANFINYMNAEIAHYKAKVIKAD